MVFLDSSMENQPLIAQAPFIMVIFGATGDLAKNKLIPSLYSLYKKNQLPKTFYIVGFARRSLSNEDFRKIFDNKFDAEFLNNLYYQKGQFEEEEGYKNLIEKLNSFDKQIGACITRLFYLATPPDNYETILDFLDSTKLSEGCGPASAHLASTGRQGSSKWTKLIIEKPFGKNLETAKELDKKLVKIFEEKQIFRVDHYLGKETVQNMIAFRFANGIFEPVWNKNHIDSVQITWGEEKGVLDRGKFFDGVGLLRDVAQNHLMQLIAAVAMEQPKSFSKEDVRDARANAIKAIRPIKPEEVLDYVVKGQYREYTKEKDIAKDSKTETFIAMKLFVDTKRFENIPFYLRACKKAPKNVVEISIVFIQTCHILFKEYGCPEIGNVLTIRIQPDEGITLRVIAKKPFDSALGKPGLALATVDMGFSYQKDFGEKGADAYEKILLDIFSGDQMLFNRSDELESSWQLITNILQGWDKQGSKIKTYESGEWGPKEANTLIEKDSRKWL